MKDIIAPSFYHFWLLTRQPEIDIHSFMGIQAGPVTTGCLASAR